MRDGEGKICVLDIDVKGARDIYASGKIDCNYLFVKTPTLKDLELRLIARKTETPESLRKRLDNAEREVKFAEESGLFTKFLSNDKVEDFMREADEFII